MTTRTTAPIPPPTAPRNGAPARTPPPSPSSRRAGDERAQSTVEYALILLGAAAIALMVVAWVTGSDAIGQLFDAVMGRILQQAG